MGEFQEKSSSLLQKQIPAYSVVRHDWNWNGTGFCGQMKLKNSFLWLQTHQMCLVQTGIKKYPCLRLNMLLDIICCGPIFLLEVLDILFRYIVSWIKANYFLLTDKKK